jgi:hypothetical protein
VPLDGFAPGARLLVGTLVDPAAPDRPTPFSMVLEPTADGGWTLRLRQAADLGAPAETIADFAGGPQEPHPFAQLGFDRLVPWARQDWMHD